MLGSKGGALDELLGRTKNGALHPSQLDGLMSAALSVQADTSIPWDETWGDLFAELFTQGVGTATQHQQYARGVYQCQVKVRPGIRQRSPIVLGVLRSHHRGQGRVAQYYYVEFGEHITIGGRTRDHRSKASSGSGMTNSSANNWDTKVFLADRPPFESLEVGKHELVYIEPIEIRLGGPTGSLIAAFDRKATDTVEIFPIETDDIELITDAQAAVVMETAFSIDHNQIKLRPQGNRPGRFYAQFTVLTPGTPVPFGYQIIAHSRQHEWELGTIASKDPTRGKHQIGLPWPREHTADHIDLIFRPSADVARKTLDVDSILDHEFVIKDVEVVR